MIRLPLRSTLFPYTTLFRSLAVANAVLGMALGLFLSAFASTEFQAVQFMPAVLFPQVLLCGLLAPREHMPHVLRVASDADRKSTRLNSSHQIISYAVFCLKN